MFYYNKKYQTGDQWLIDTEYTEYQDLLPLVESNPNTEYSNETVAFNARQYPLWSDPVVAQTVKHKQYRDNYVQHPAWEEATRGIFEWTKRRLKRNKIDLNFVPTISWSMEYGAGGWQSMHTHDSDCITQIFYLDGEINQDPNISAKENAWGSMYAFLTKGDKPIYKSFSSWAGRCIILRGDIFHGVYPIKTLPRRTIIMDYKVIR